MHIRTDERFMKERQELNGKLMKYAGLPIKRFFSLDSMVYKEGELDARTKELMGLVGSTVLRCDDCIRYHVIQVHDLGITSAQFAEAMAVAMVVGGSITIPHQRRAFALWDELEAAKASGQAGNPGAAPKPESHSHEHDSPEDEPR